MMTMAIMRIMMVITMIWNDDGDNKGKFDDDNNLCGDATIIRDYWLNQGHFLKDDKQEALNDVDHNLYKNCLF